MIRVTSAAILAIKFAVIPVAFIHAHTPAPHIAPPMTVTVAYSNSPTASQKVHLASVPRVFSAKQNYPNPFNSSTTIEYSLPQEASVYVAIYNSSGHRVRTLVNEIGSAGRHVVSWDGRNDKGELVASGVYFYQFVADDFYVNHKMLLIK
ncbi:MAG: FlgD immunoglobulin-like domain containing protein [Candidatus Zixiibacteriota bacterium]